MKKIINLFMSFFIILSLKQAYAVAFVTPVKITHPSPETYTYIQKIVSWDEDAGALNPCYGWSSCWVGPDVVYDVGPGNLGSCIGGGGENCIEISKMRTAKEVSDAYRATLGIPKTATFNSGMIGVCTGLVYIQNPNGGYGQGSLWPKSICGKIPPIDQSCDMSLPPIVDYGTLGSNSLDGKKATITGQVTCSQSGMVRLYGRSRTGEKNVFLNSNRSLYATLSINDSSAFDGVDVNVPGNRAPVNFSFTTTIQTSGKIDSGTYEGTAIVLLTYP